MDNRNESIGLNQAARILQDTRAQAEEAEEAAEAEQAAEEELTPSEDAGDDAEVLEATEDEEQHEESGEEEPVYTVKANGQEHEVTLSELLSGYQRDADYRQKTMELAETRKRAESHAQEISQKRQDLVSRLDAMSEALGDKPPFTKEQIREAKEAGEFDRSSRMFQENQEWKEHRQEMTDQREQILKDARDEAVTAFNKALPDEIPDWRDRDKAQKESAEVYQYLRDRGYGDEWIGNLVDAKAIAMIRNSMLFERQQKGKAKVMKKVTAAPKMQKPGAPRPANTDQRQQEKKLLKNVEESHGIRAIRGAASFLKARRESGSRH